MKKIILTLIAVLLLQTNALANSIKFIQVTDAHFRSEDSYRTQVLQQTVSSINKEKGISFVVFTGDNIDSPKPEYLQEFIKTVNKLNIPYYIVIGNHDVFKNNGLSKSHYLEIVHDNNFKFRYKNPNYSFKKKGFVFVVADGAKEVIPGSTGYYREETLNWLDKKLTQNKKHPVVIFQHYPVVEPKVLKSHEVYQKEKYLDIIDKHNNLVSIISGHYHINNEIMRNGVYHISTPTLLNAPNSYKIINIVTTKGFSPMIYTELKEVETK